MTIEGKFLKRLAIASVLIFAAGMWPLIQAAHDDTMVFVAAGIGFGLSAFNVLAGFLAITFGRTKDAQTMNMIVFGGMTARMLFMLGMIILCVRFFEIPAIPMVASLFVFYLTFLVIEVQFLWSTSRRP